MALHSGRSSGGCFGEEAGVDVLMFGNLVGEGVMVDTDIERWWI